MIAIAFFVGVIVLASLVHESGHVLAWMIQRTPVRLVIGVGSRPLWTWGVVEVRHIPLGIGIFPDPEAKARTPIGGRAATLLAGPLANLVVLAAVLVLWPGSYLAKWVAGGHLLGLLQIVPFAVWAGRTQTGESNWVFSDGAQLLALCARYRAGEDFEWEQRWLHRMVPRFTWPYVALGIGAMTWVLLTGTQF